MDNNETVQSQTIEYLTHAQQLFTERSKRCANDRIVAYLRWHLNNRFEQYEQEIGQVKRPSPSTPADRKRNVRRKKRQNKSIHAKQLTHICDNCGSHFTHYRTIPKKLPRQRQPKKGCNYRTTIVNARCELCKSRFKFEIETVKPKSVDRKAKIRNSSEHVVSHAASDAKCRNPKNKNNLTNVIKIDRRQSLPNKNNTNYNRSKNQQTPTTSGKSHKEILQKLLGDSKKKRNLDSKTRLSDFLSDCLAK